MVDDRRHRVLFQPVVSSRLQTGTRFNLAILVPTTLCWILHVVETLKTHWPPLRRNMVRDAVLRLAAERVFANSSKENDTTLWNTWLRFAAAWLRFAAAWRVEPIPLSPFFSSINSGFIYCGLGTVLLSSTLLKPAVAMCCSQASNQVVQRS